MSTRRHNGPQFFGRVPRPGIRSLLGLKPAALKVYLALSTWSTVHAFDGFSVSDALLLDFSGLDRRTLQRGRNELADTGFIDFTPGTGARPTAYLLTSDPARARVQNAVDIVGKPMPGGDTDDAPGATPPSRVRTTVLRGTRAGSLPPQRARSTAPDPGPPPPPQNHRNDARAVAVKRHTQWHVADLPGTRARGCLQPINPATGSVAIAELTADDVHRLAPWCMLCWQSAPELYEIIEGR